MGYLPILLFVLISLGLACALVGVSWVLGKRRAYLQKQLPYECGFDPINGDARTSFDIHFAIVAILFIIFDVEIAFLIPLAILSPMTWEVLAPGLGFLGILTLGFVYEWKKGALDWP